VRELTVLYDADCGMCRRFKDWLAAQHPAPDGYGGVVRLRFVAAGSTDARAIVQAAAGLRRLSGGDYADGCDGQCDREG
jgi:predicted DCC family thiol-disulfide oxidoreductase YuxK